MARVQWEVVNAEKHGFTGFYAETTDSVVLRLSETNNLTKISEGLLPSLALKFLRDGAISENLFAMPNFTGTNSWNFFENPMSNRVEPYDKKTDKCEILTI